MQTAKPSSISAIKRDDFVAGSFLFLVAFLILGLSVLIVPELQDRAAYRTSDLHKQASALVQVRRDAIHEQDVLMRTLNSLESTEDDDAVGAGGTTEPLNKATITNAVGGNDPGAAGPQEVASLLAQNAVVIASAGEQLRLFAEQSGDASSARLDVKNVTRISRTDWLSYNELVLVLAMLMGILGGVISVAKAFISPDATNPPASDYFIRPLFGAVIAFVIFLLFKAGSPIFTLDTATNALNPFPIALLGVVSGMMSNEAIGTLEKWAASVFGGSAPSSSNQEDRSAELSAEIAAQLERVDKIERALSDSASTEETPESAAKREAATDAAAIARRLAGEAKENIDRLPAGTRSVPSSAANALARLKSQVNLYEAAASEVSATRG